MDPKLITPLLISALVVWALYRRVRRTFGRQRVSASRLSLRAVILGIAALALLAGAARDMTLLGWLLGGLGGGALLGLISLRHTRFELERGQRFYTSHAYFGVAILALFLGRVIFRFVTLYSRGGIAAAPADRSFGGYGQSPMTLTIVGLLLGYYLLYSVGVLLKARNLSPSEHQDLTT